MGINTTYKYLNIHLYTRKDFYIREKNNEYQEEKTMNMDEFLTTKQLATRWSLKMGTIRLWRWYGKGPNYIKVGGRILYDIEKIREFEKEQLRQHTSMSHGSALKLS